MAENPRLSVVIPMRNCGASITSVLDSLLRQRVTMQIIIVDDASDDDSVSRVEEWSKTTGQPVELLRNGRQLYSYASRLIGMACVKAPVVWQLDADDIIPANANVPEALAIMEREQPDILHCKACGVSGGSFLQKPLAWTEPVADALYGGDIFKAFMADSYPPATLWNKFFSAALVRRVVATAPNVEVRYFDVKFLGLLFVLHAQSYLACNELIYEYRMRAHRPAWLYARQVSALLLLDQALAPLIEAHAPGQLEAFHDYCVRRLTIQTGHLSIMAEAELKRGRQSPEQWFQENIAANIGHDSLLRALHISMEANARRLNGWREQTGALCGKVDKCLPDDSPRHLMQALVAAAHDALRQKFTDNERLARRAFHFGLCQPETTSYGTEFAGSTVPLSDLAIALLLGNSQLARAITAIMAPQTDITRQAN